MRQKLRQWKNEQAHDLINSRLPFSIRKAAMLLHEAVIECLDFDVLERRKLSVDVV